MIPNYGEKWITLIRRQRVATGSLQPSAIVEQNITQAQIFGIEILEKQRYKWRSLNARDTELVNHNFVDSQNSHIIEDDKQVTATTSTAATSKISTILASPTCTTTAKLFGTVVLLL